jgi:branched-subunit amino acid aminotransferase/4-amino-4-deoxychorismate lyase
VVEELGVREEPIGLEHVVAADELFVTSAVRGVQPARVAEPRRAAKTAPVAAKAARALAARWRLAMPSLNTS